MTLRLRSTDEILAEGEAEESWLIKPLLAKGSICQIYGRQGLGKTTLLAQLAHTFATGEPWLGFRPEVTGPTLMLQLDMPERDMRLWLGRMTDLGLDLSQMATANPDGSFDIEKSYCQQALKDACEEVQPVCVFVDTIKDAFYHKAASDDAVRRSIRKLEAAVEPAVLIFTNHTRKKGSYVAFKEQQDGKDLNDPDSFSGFGAYEQVATASLEIVEWKNGFHLPFRKTRLGSMGFEWLKLNRKTGGIFEAQTTHGQMLVQWPNSLPKERRVAATRRCTSILSVCKVIAEETGEKVDTIRKMHQRMRDRGVDPLSQLKDE